jgi:hypothetical protein
MRTLKACSKHMYHAAFFDCCVRTIAFTGDTARTLVSVVTLAAVVGPRRR